MLQGICDEHKLDFFLSFSSFLWEGHKGGGGHGRKRKGVCAQGSCYEILSKGYLF